MYYDTRSNTERGLRRLETKLSDGALLGPPDTGWTVELLALCGLVPVVATPKPADTDTTTHVRSVQRVNGTPTVVWTPRPWTETELRGRMEAATYVDPTAQVAILAELVVAGDVKAGTLTDAEVARRAPLFPPWLPGIAVKVGEVYRWDGTLVEVIQAHTTQTDWAPDKVPALFKVHRKPGVVAWVDGASYKLDDVVTFGGNRYRCRQAHTAHLGAGWTPVVYAAGWVLLGPV